MLERRTFIVRIHAHAPPILEDVSTRQRVRLPDLQSIAGELERRLDGPAGDAPAIAGAEHDQRA